ncbi:hypothetical protein SKAU_G00363830 [Synaphobranchus kaupii]|uniref:Uncharacterized protein n=1 Tax=Synaphobranchus kaupii TaxID=118154 RepID=A0A9Q1EIU9_SYNKA|nr:hypothetical protein SKAU_G00363830 [Synaphobranchus kaupii]
MLMRGDEIIPGLDAQSAAQGPRLPQRNGSLPLHQMCWLPLHSKPHLPGQGQRASSLAPSLSFYGPKEKRRPQLPYLGARPGQFWYAPERREGPRSEPGQRAATDRGKGLPRPCLAVGGAVSFMRRSALACGKPLSAEGLGRDRAARTRDRLNI